MQVYTFTKTHNKHKLIFCCLATILLLILRDAIGVNISKLYFAAFAMICFVILERNDLLAYFFFISPFCQGLPYNIIGMEFLCIYVIKKRKIKIDPVIALCAFLMLFIEIVHVGINSSNLVEFVRLAIFIVIATIILSETYDNDDLKLFSVMFVIGVVFAGAILILYTARIFGWNSVFSGLERLGVLASHYGNDSDLHIRFNPNEIGNYVDVSLASLLVMWKKKLIRTKFLLLLGLVLLVIGFLGMSRTFVIVTAFLFVYYLLSFGLRIFHLAKNFLAIFILLFMASLLINTYMPQVLDNVISRFQDADISNGRFDILKEYFIASTTNVGRFLFGYGLQDYSNTLSSNASAHNFVQELLVVWGLSGLVLFTTWLFAGINRIRLKNQIERINYLPIFTALLASQSGQLISQYQTLIYIALLVKIIALKSDNERIKMIKERYI